MDTGTATKPESSAAFNPTAWVDEHGDYLFAFAMSRLRDKFLAEDMVQDTFVAAIQSGHKFEARSSERTWLCGILKHKVLDHFRKSSREVELTEEEADMSSYEYLFQDSGVAKGHWTADSKPTVWEENPEKVLEHAEFRGILSHCLGELPERVANVFILREMDGYDSHEICDLLSISPNNVWIMMHRARLHLRRCIDVNWFKKVES